jgi:hypothetical protein
MEDRPQRDISSVLRNQAFDDIREVSGLAASYARSIDEAAWRGDQTTVLAHLQQLRFCIVTMIKTYKDYLEGGHAGDGSP